MQSGFETPETGVVLISLLISGSSDEVVFTPIGDCFAILLEGRNGGKIGLDKGEELLEFVA
jgi:hypothetical protein